MQHSPTRFLAGCLTVIAISIPQLTNGQGVQNTRESRKILSVAKINSRLDQPCAFEFKETPMQEVMQSLEKAVGTNIILGKSALDDSLSPDEPITCRLSHVQLRTAIQVMLDRHNATYILSDGLLKIISKDIAGDVANFRREIFDCSQLMEQIAQGEALFPSYPNALGGSNQSGGVFNQAPGSNSSTSAAQDKAVPNSDQQMLRLARRNSASSLNDLIRGTVHPDDWSDTNGDFELQTIGGLVVVSASENCLSEVRSLLNELKQKLAKE